MKILVFLHELVLGGTTVNCLELSAELRDRHGHDVVLFATPGPMLPLVRSHGLRYVPAPFALTHPSPARMRALRRLVRLEAPDLLYAWEDAACLDAYYGVHLAMRVPVLVTDMQMNVTRRLPKALFTTFGTPELVDVARSRGRDRVDLLLPPVDLHSNAPGAVDPAVVRSQWGVDSTHTVLVTVSRLVDSLKGESLIRTIDAIGSLTARPDLRLVVVGDGTARSQIAALANEVNAQLGRSAVLLAGPMQDPRPAYAAADIVIGMGGSALRGMAFEKPVIVVGERAFSARFDESTAAEFLYRGIYGIGTGELDNGRLESNIFRLANDRMRWGAIGRFSRNFVQTHFSLDAVSKRLDEYCVRAAEIDDSLPKLALDAVRTTAVYLRERRFLWRASPPAPMQCVDIVPPGPTVAARSARERPGETRRSRRRPDAVCKPPITPVIPAGAGLRCACFVVDASTFGGVEVHTIGLIRTLVESGVAVQLISCRNREYDARLADEVRTGAVRILHTSLSIRESGPGAFWAWRELLRAVPRGVVILPKPWHPVGGLMLHWLLKRHADPFIVIEHLEADRLSFRFLRNPLNLLRRRTWILLYRLVDRNLCARLATRVVAVSQVVKQRLLDDWHYPPDRIVTIRNGIHWRSFARTPERCARARATHLIGARAFVFGMLARLSHDKGIDVAIDAMHQLVRRDPDTRAVLVVAGQGTARTELETQVAGLGLAAHVRFLGFIEDSSTLVAAFDAIVFASRREGLPLGLLEAMAAGCVPIVTRVSGMPEVVTDAGVGWVVPAEDPTALATAMGEVLDIEPARLQAFRQRAAMQVRENFDAKTSYEKLSDLLVVPSHV